SRMSGRSRVSTATSLRQPPSERFQAATAPSGRGFLRRRLLPALGRARRSLVDRADLLDALVPALVAWTGVALDHDPAQPGALERLAERVGIADEDDRRRVGSDMGGRGRLDVVDRNVLDACSVVRQLVVGQVMDGESGERADDGARRLEPEREDADEEVA